MPHRVIVARTAGVGLRLRALEQGIWNIAMESFGQEQYTIIRIIVRLAAFTGKAAYQVCGPVTIHSLFSMMTVHQFRPLLVEAGRQLQRDLQHVWFLFLDEMSMIVFKLLFCID